MEDPERVVAVCDRCGSVYAAKVLLSGQIRPIGTQNCTCGNGTFRKLQ